MIKKSEKVLILSATLLFLIVLGCTVGYRATENAPNTVSLQSLPHPTAVAAVHSGRININTATAEQLMELPGIGPSLSRRIVEYRQIHGSFATAEDLLNIKGIGPKTLADMRQYITTGGAS